MRWAALTWSLLYFKKANQSFFWLQPSQGSWYHAKRSDRNNGMSWRACLQRNEIAKVKRNLKNVRANLTPSHMAFWNSPWWVDPFSERYYQLPNQNGLIQAWRIESSIITNAKSKVTKKKKTIFFKVDSVLSKFSHFWFEADSHKTRFLVCVLQPTTYMMTSRQTP